jgi:RNA polymerase sigma factor (sigma-70 family)
MRKRVLYFDMEKIEQDNEPLCESEQEVAERAGFDPRPGLQLRFALNTALETLTPRQRQVVDLLAAGHKEQEIAGLLGISQPVVHKLLDKARVRLKKSLGEGGIKQPQSA